MYNVSFDCKCGMEQVLEVEPGIETYQTCFNCNKEHVVLITPIGSDDEETEEEDPRLPDSNEEEDDEQE